MKVLEGAVAAPNAKIAVVILVLTVLLMKVY